MMEGSYETQNILKSVSSCFIFLYLLLKFYCYNVQQLFVDFFTKLCEDKVLLFFIF